MNTKRRMSILAVAVGFSASLLVVAPVASADHLPVHVLHVAGASTFPTPCEYVRATPQVVDDLGIPKPSTLPPTCVDTNPFLTGIQQKDCELARNTFPVTTLPACAGNISAEDDASPILVLGCLDPLDPNAVQCEINAPTWFYGYCGQTYGGATSGTFKINGNTWNINRMGFTRGRGAWEFSGKITFGTQTQTFRMHLAAIPDQTNQLAGCDVSHNIRRITFGGTLTIPAPPVKVFRTSAQGWHYCYADPSIKADLADGC